MLRQGTRIQFESGYNGSVSSHGFFGPNQGFFGPGVFWPVLWGPKTPDKFHVMKPQKMSGVFWPRGFLAQGYFCPFILTQGHPYLHVAHGAASNSDSAISPYLCHSLTPALFELLSYLSIIVVTRAVCWARLVEFNPQSRRI